MYLLFYGDPGNSLSFILRYRFGLNPTLVLDEIGDNG